LRQGDALLQLILDDPLLALARADGKCPSLWMDVPETKNDYVYVLEPSFQILHSMYALEQALNKFSKRSAVYEVVFWEG
jgi:hypothetical protein